MTHDVIASIRYVGECKDFSIYACVTPHGVRYTFQPIGVYLPGGKRKAPDYIINVKFRNAP